MLHFDRRKGTECRPPTDDLGLANLTTLTVMGRVDREEKRGRTAILRMGHQEVRGLSLECSAWLPPNCREQAGLAAQ